jgi:hypothetical protein
VCDQHSHLISQAPVKERSHGFQLITFLLEQGPEGLVMLWAVIAAIVTKVYCGTEVDWEVFAYVTAGVPLVLVIVPILCLFFASRWFNDMG